jgi:hypothetical protein
MHLEITGNGAGLEIRLVVAWRTLKAILAAVAALLAAPEVARIGALLGWW